MTKTVYEFEKAKNPSDFRQGWKSERGKLVAELAQTRKLSEKARLGGRPLDARQLGEKAEQIALELELLDDTYEQRKGERLISEYHNRAEILGGLESKIKDLDETAIQGFNVAFEALNKRVVLDKERATVQTRIASTAAKYSLDGASGPGQQQTAWGKELKVTAPDEATRAAFRLYAQRFAQKTISAGVPLDLEKFLGRE